MKELMQISHEKATMLVNDPEIASSLKSDELLFKLPDVRMMRSDILVDLEISLRDCELSGVFKN